MLLIKILVTRIDTSSYWNDFKAEALVGENYMQYNLALTGNVVGAIHSQICEQEIVNFKAYL